MDSKMKFVNCARNKDLDLDYTLELDVCLAYKMYLEERWKYDKIKPKWEKFTSIYDYLLHLEEKE